MNFLRSLLSRPSPAPARFDTELAVDRVFAVVGDIHGRADLLEALLTMLETVLPADGLLIFVGDFIDRGEQSAEVLRRLREITQSSRPFETICLMGNHERMFLDFLDRPASVGPRWKRYGGLQTMGSFGFGLIAESAGAEEWIERRDALRATMSGELENWLRDLPLQWHSGNLHVVHAGADPSLPMSLQPAKSLLWGSDVFATVPRDDGQWVAHGHTIVDEAQVQPGRIAVDTGAYATGRLTAAIFRPGTQDVQFIQT